MIDNMLMIRKAIPASSELSESTIAPMMIAMVAATAEIHSAIWQTSQKNR